jgi:methylated-DNA-[protein]-cysteine S-methyltransferase
MFATLLDTPIGLLQIEANETKITLVRFVGSNGANVLPKTPDTVLPQVIQDCVLQINEYFSGERQAFDLSILLDGTELQQKVWKSISEVEYGKTVSFSDVAEVVDKLNAIMVIGQIVHSNPLQIIIPDHRVVSQEGVITGYQDDIFRKDWLMRHEQRLAGESLF